MIPIDPKSLARGGAARPLLTLAAGTALPLARAHEVCGPARAVFAAMTAGLGAALWGAEAPVLWIRNPRAEGRLNPDGVAAFFAPGRLVIAAPRRAEDVLWCAEEALRSGAAPLVVAELPAPPRLTPVRRLHLAAEAGRAARGTAAAALLLTPGEGGAEGVETRWRLSAAPSGARPWTEGGPAAWRLERLRARLDPPRVWRAEWRPAPGREGPLRLTPHALA